MEVLRFLHGMIIASDYYYCYSSTQPSDERRACFEIFDGSPDWLLEPYMQCGWAGMSFVVENRKLESKQDYSLHEGAVRYPSSNE